GRREREGRHLCNRAVTAAPDPAGRGAACTAEARSGARAELQHGGEASEDHSLTLERDRAALRIQPRILHDLRHRRISSRLVRPFDPGEHTRFVLLRLYGTTEVGELPVPDVITPALENALRAVLHEHRVSLLGVFDELLLVTRGHRDHETIDIA